MTTHAGESHLELFLEMLLFSNNDAMNLYTSDKCLSVSRLFPPTPSKSKSEMSDNPHEKSFLLVL